jgi:hypothetical protein
MITVSSLPRGQRRKCGASSSRGGSNVDAKRLNGGRSGEGGGREREKGIEGSLLLRNDGLAQIHGGVSEGRE